MTSRFDDARHLVEHCHLKFAELKEMHAQCLNEQTIEPRFLIEVKNFMENLRSALDYCAAALFANHGKSKKSAPRIYFPIAKHGDDRTKFREQTVEHCIPGLLQSRPDIVDRLEAYQYFGNTGNWLPIFAKITNENKHQQLTPHVEKEYTAVRITGTLRKGESVDIDLMNIPLGGGSDKPFQAVAATWKGLTFSDTDVLVMPLLGHAVWNVRQIVEELSSL